MLSSRTRLGPCPQALREPQKVAVGILHQQFAVADILDATPVPSVLRLAKKQLAARRQAIPQCLCIVNLDLKVDASTERLLQLPREPTAALLNHEMRAAHSQVGEWPLRAIVDNLETDEPDVEIQAGREVRHFKFGYKSNGSWKGIGH